jgi:hypothetical protein
MEITPPPSENSLGPVNSTLPRYGGIRVIAIVLQFGRHNALAAAANVLDRPIGFDIAANIPLEDALIEWSMKASVTVVMNTRTVDLQGTRGIRGTIRARTTLEPLLRDSGLSYTEDEPTIRVTRPYRPGDDPPQSRIPQVDSL